MIKLNKKLGYIFVVLVAGLFVVSACEQGGIGAKPARQLERGGEDPVVQSDHDVRFTTRGEYVYLNTKVNGRNDINQKIFYNDNGRIKRGSGIDEPLVTQEQEIIHAEDMNVQDLSGMTGVRFVYDFNGISHIVNIQNIDTLNNRVSFRVLDTGRSYNNLPYNNIRDTEFNFLETPFVLIFEEDSINFYHINDMDGTSRIRTNNNGEISIASDDGVDIYNPQNRQEDYIAVYFRYNRENMEINPSRISIGTGGWLSQSRILLDKSRGAGVDEIKIKF